MTQDTMRILAQDRLISNNTRTTKLNNNDLIIGPTGAGKTRNYVKPNLLQYALEGGCSLIIADTKGSLVEEVGPVMAAHVLLFNRLPTLRVPPAPRVESLPGWMP